MSENYDLGTAHAKIKVTADERGIKDAERAFAHWDKGMAEFKTTVGRLEHSINSLERSVDDLNSTVKRSEREFDKYDGTVKETSKSHSKLSNSINVLNGDFNTLIERLKTAGSLYAKLKAPTAFGIKFTKDVRSGEDSLKGLGKAFVSSGIAAAGLKIGLRSISLSSLGLNSGMQNGTGWRRFFLKLN